MREITSLFVYIPRFDYIEIGGEKQPGSWVDAVEYDPSMGLLGEMINSLIEAGLQIEFLHEFPFAARAKFSFLEQGGDGWWRLPEPNDGTIPILLSWQARKT